jgi:hypothetical protein
MQFGPGFVATFLYYFSSTAVVLAFVTMQSTGLNLATGIPQQVGGLGGLIAGILGAYFNRTICFSVPVEGRKKFLNQLDSTLAGMGYEKISDEEGVQTYQRSAWSQWFSGRIFVQVEDQQATIASRAITVRSLKKVLK